jgi:colanic acid/amylovoran biosynthesis glycosyltransferase
MKVIHFIRKNTQLKASFIQNQVKYHIDFIPFVVYCEHRESQFDGGFTDQTGLNVPVYCIADNTTLLDRIVYKYFKILGRSHKRNLDKIVKNIQPDIIHLHYGTDAGIYLPALKKSKIPKIVSFYGYDAYSFPKKYFGYGGFFLRKKVFSNANKILAMSQEMQNDLIKACCPLESLIIHYHGVPIEKISDLSLEYIRKSDYRLTMISYLDPVKGHYFVLMALKWLIDNGFKDFHLRIAGEGHYEKFLKQKSKELGLEDSVSFLGKVKYLSDEHLKLLFETDIYLHPSVCTKDDKEGIPGSLVEAMVAGLPVISTFHGGIPFVIENQQTGLLVKELDVKGIADAIMMLVGSCELRRTLGLSGKEYAMKNMDVKRQEAELENIYKKLL